MARIAASRGWTVALAGLGINLALGVLYSWSVVAKVLSKPVAEGGWGWSAGQASLPYAIGVGVFALSMVFAGRAQDRLGPRIVASVGGALCGLGLIVASFATPENTLPITLGFGLLTGLGIGLGYAAATPAAVKWFPPNKKGLITGIVVAGFGLASVYIAPLTTWLLADQGVPGTFRVLGIAFLITTVLLAQLLVNPPAGYVAVTRPEAVNSGPAVQPADDYDWRDMVRTRQFARLWLMYAFSAFAGLMIIGHMAKIAAAQLPLVDLGFLLVAVLAVGNAAGRVAAGIAADRIGGTRTMLVVFVVQAVMMAILAFANTTAALVPVAAVIGFCYGANLSLFPSTTAGFFGTKNLGVNYGLVFTAWGFGGVFGSMTAGTIVDSTGTYAAAYGVAAVLCLAAGALSLGTKPPAPRVVGERQKAVERRAAA
ncbi:MAG TPA: OFA family MFS transporter [Coriobacteriia bacterium]|nr:OFA family MFS transporter [Coriobacteriia bacterium]